MVDVDSSIKDQVVLNYENDDANVERVEVDQVRQAETVVSDPAYADQWALPRIGWDQAYGTVTPAGTATIAVLDTGVDATVLGTDRLVPGFTAFTGGSATTDNNGHGTRMASIAAAGTNDGTGIAGVAYAGAKVMPVQVLDSGGAGQDSDIIAGLVAAADAGADVALMAFSSSSYSQDLQDAVDYAWSLGMVLVAAVGNDASSTPAYPAGDAKVVGVSATDQTDALWSGSNYGADTFLAAPGVDVLAEGPAPAGGIQPVTGTSASTAIVAAAAALLAANDTAASNGVIVGRLARTADPAGTQAQTGNGRVNLARALADTSTGAVAPAGTGASGGPFVGPYVTEAVNQHVEGWANLSGGSWQGTLNGTNSAYNEGDSIPVRFIDEDQNAGSTQTVTLRYDVFNGNRHFVDSLTTYDRTITSGVTSCSGFTCPGSPTTVAIPADTTVPPAGRPAGVFTIYNATITGLSAYSFDGGKRQIDVTYQVTSGGGPKDVVLLFGAHLARQNEWGTGNGAASFPGGSGAITAVFGNKSPSATVNPGQAVSPGATISGKVYNDLDGDGVLDGGEVGIAGVSMTLSGTTSDTATTGADGGYTFGDLSVGTYNVDYSVPAGFVNTGVQPLTNISVPSASSTVTNQNFFAQQRNASISGTVYNDANGDGAFTVGEVGIPGVTVTLNGGTPAQSPTTVTGAGGAYSFGSLPAGTYTIDYTLPGGYSNTGTKPLSGVVLTAGQTLAGQNFFARQQNGSISGTLYNDLNGDGSFTAGEPGISGVTVLLSGPAPGSTTTAAGGSYSFGGLVAGSYSVDYSVPAGFADTGGRPLPVTLSAGQASTGNDFFAQQQDGSIAGAVYNDVNGNGVFDPGDSGVSGVIVSLSGSVTGSTTTGAGGTYSFTLLPAGSYSVDYNEPVGFGNTGTRPLPVTLTAGQASTGQNLFMRRTTSTALALTTGTNPSTYGDTVTFTATVTSASGLDPSTGMVTFKDGVTPLCTVALGGDNEAGCSPPLAAGSYSITAEYTGTASAPGFSGSTSSAIAHTVTKKFLTVTPADQTKVYGSADPAFTRTVTGFVGSDDGSDLTTAPTCGVAGAH
ncbi:MAG: SdrD B-like domain-containing protein, partial [Nocardioidaceae bacterium]